MSVTNNFYFGGKNEEEDNIGDEPEQTNFGGLLFKVVQGFLIIAGIVYILSFFPQFRKYTITPKTNVTQSKLITDDLERQNKELNQERERFYARPKRTKRQN